MTCTPQQKQILMRYAKTHGQEVAAAKGGMSLRTARQYLKRGGLMMIEETTKNSSKRTDVFDAVWPELERLLTVDPGLQVKMLMQMLMDRDETFHWGLLRTLQRRVRDWRALKGADQDVKFRQVHIPGAQSQSDWTHCEELDVTIGGASFPHMLFHFMLPYSRWETAYISYSESYDNLVSGYTRAITELGAVPKEHRTDNLTAAVTSHGSRHVFTERWQNVMDHYGAKPTRNNPGESHENGSVEKSHHLLKSELNQLLKLRQSKEFSSVAEYEKFLRKALDRRNRGRKVRLAEEMAVMKEPPQRAWNEAIEERVVVNAFSLITVSKALYTVPSRLIGHELRALVYAETVRLFLGNTLVLEMPRQQPGGKRINYRHLVSHLMRKPGAFANYVFRDDLFPSLVFRQAYDRLVERKPERAEKEYLAILHYAAMGSEQDIETALELLLASGATPCLEAVKELAHVHVGALPDIQIPVPELFSYDQLLSYIPQSHKEL
jgi:transposase